MANLQAILKSVRPEFEFSENDDFLALGMLDSFDVIMLVSELEKVYGISIEGVDILPDNLRSMGSIRSLLARYGVAECN